ncbi:MAG: hypothetical protein IJ527_06355 [Prevotella sp.]|nr:hypothetical protein [Prevotella sp.]
MEPKVTLDDIHQTEQLIQAVEENEKATNEERNKWIDVCRDIIERNGDTGTIANPEDYNRLNETTDEIKKLGAKCDKLEKRRSELSKIWHQQVAEYIKLSQAANPPQQE